MLIVLTIIPMKLPDWKKEEIWTSPFRQLKDGVSYLFKEPVTRVFTIIGIILPILVIPIFSTLPPIYAVKVFGDKSGKVLGFLMASVGVGGIVGGVVSAYMRRIEHWGRDTTGVAFSTRFSPNRFYLHLEPTGSIGAHGPGWIF